MRAINPSLLAAFKDGNRATLLKITTKDNTVYGYTDWDVAIERLGVTYRPAPGLTRPTLTATVNDQVSNQEFTSAWVDVPEAMLTSGKFDNALVEIAYCHPLDDAPGIYLFDKGNIGVIQWTADGFRADMQSHMRNLTRNINFLYTASCRHQLFSQFSTTSIGACTLNKLSYTFTGSVSVVLVDRLRFTTTGFGQPAGMCTNGVLTWTSGPATGMSYPVKSQGAAEIELFLPSFAPLWEGHTFSITAGCDKKFDTCKTKFNNGVNFGGFPHIQSEIQYR